MLNCLLPPTHVASWKNLLNLMLLEVPGSWFLPACCGSLVGLFTTTRYLEVEAGRKFWILNILNVAASPQFRSSQWYGSQWYGQLERRVESAF